MISKAKIQNGYIKNDFGKLRQKFVEAADFHGFGTDWMDSLSCLIHEDIYIDSEFEVESYTLTKVKDGFM
jgi:hypothetical protein